MCTGNERRRLGEGTLVSRFLAICERQLLRRIGAYEMQSKQIAERSRSWLREIYSTFRHIIFSFHRGY